MYDMDLLGEAASPPFVRAGPADGIFYRGVKKKDFISPPPMGPDIGLA